MSRLLLVEDDRTLRTAVADALTLEGHDVTTAADGVAAQELVLSRHFDAVVLDLMLPRRGGLEVLKELRGRRLDTPVLVLTARSDEADKVIGLELGADDYVTKPFSLKELLARVKALLRRARSRDAGRPAVEQFHLGDMVVDLARFELRRGKTVHALSPKEAAMLALLFQEAGKVVPRRRFLEEVWKSAEFVGDRTIDTHVLNLRKKLERDPRRPQHLLTVHGAGYRLVLTSS